MSAMKNEYMIGCNYWASNAGTEMWRNFDKAAIRDDLRILSEHGIEYMRVFPNWRDFQPVIPVYTPGYSEYILDGDVRPTNPYYLDEKMIDEFLLFCDICEEYGIKLVVGLLTGWMSGRLFLPPVLYGKDIYNDPEALMLESYFVKGFVNAAKDKPAIYAWDLGNECNCINGCKDRFTAASWTAFISNAIRAQDATRPIFSGMHTIAARDNGKIWTIEDQGEFCDMLTTHPYPYFVEHVFLDNYVSLRTTMHASCETKYYSDLGGIPCLMEEIGTLGPITCDNEYAAKFARLNFFSGWANGSRGMMWWCANDQDELRTIPYTRSTCETELGMITSKREPKPVLKEFKKFSDFIHNVDFTLPSANEDAVCVLTRGQDQWGVAYMSYILAKQAGMNLRFAFIDDEIPKANVYMMPSIKGGNMPFEQWDIIMKRVEEGAKLYISAGESFIRDFEKTFGCNIRMSERRNDSGTIELNGNNIDYSREVVYYLEPTRAEVIAADDKGNPAITKAAYGSGQVYFVNFPLEEKLINESYAFDNGKHEIYAEIFKDIISSHAVVCNNSNLALTLHEADCALYCIIVNHSEECQETNLTVKDGYRLAEIIYGDDKVIGGYDAAVLKFE